MLAAATTAGVRLLTSFVVSFLLVTALVRSGVVPTTETYAQADHAATAAPARGEAKVTSLSKTYRCSATGLAPGVVPAHSIVRDPSQRIRLTSFDEGWAMHDGQAAGTLVAVCSR